MEQMLKDIQIIICQIKIFGQNVFVTFDKNRFFFNGKWKEKKNGGKRQAREVTFKSHPQVLQ